MKRSQRWFNDLFFGGKQEKSSKINKFYAKKGFLVMRNILSEEEVEVFRNTLDNYLNSDNSFSDDGISNMIPGFAGNYPELGDLNVLHKKSDILKILESEIFGTTDFIYANHSDLHQNKTTGWHRDTYDYLLEDRGNGTQEGLWSKECHIVKVCFLLQDHSDNDYGLWFKPKTHKNNVKGKKKIMHTNATDMIIFDQRIEHSGQTQKPQYHVKYNKNRYLLTYAFGLNNEHTKIHMKGSKIRQESQNKRLNRLSKN